MTDERMKIPLTGIEWCKERLERYRPVLCELTVDANATASYNLTADALEWSDEYPKPIDSEFNQFYAAILHMRTSVILGEDESGELRQVLGDLEGVGDGWPGTLESRFSSELASVFSELKDDAMKHVRNAKL